MSAPICPLTHYHCPESNETDDGCQWWDTRYSQCIVVTLAVIIQEVTDHGRG